LIYYKKVTLIVDKILKISKQNLCNKYKLISMEVLACFPTLEKGAETLCSGSVKQYCFISEHIQVTYYHPGPTLQRKTG